MKVDTDKVARWLDSLVDGCMLKDCPRCLAAKEFAKLVVDGALSKNVPLSAGKTFVPKKELLITAELLAKVKEEQLPNPYSYIDNFITWCKEERILKRDWHEFLLSMMRKQKLREPTRTVKFEPRVQKITDSDREKVKEMFKQYGKKESS